MKTLKNILYIMLFSIIAPAIAVSPNKTPVTVTITAINGFSIALENETFQDFMERNFSPRSGDVLIFTDSENTDYRVIVSDIPIIPVYIGISSESYWIPTTSSAIQAKPENP